MEKISLEKVAEILQRTPHIKKTEYKALYTASAEYYLLSGGQLLLEVKRDGKGFIFDSEKEFTDLLGPERGTHILEGFDIYKNDQDFLKTSKQSHLKLSELLGISSTLLNFTFKSLKLIDEKIKEQKISVKEYLQKLFPFVVPYMGETIIHEKQGQWRLIFNEECKLWEPFVQLPNKKMINVFIDLYDDAVEDYENFTVYGSAFLRLNSFF